MEPQNVCGIKPTRTNTENSLNQRYHEKKYNHIDLKINLSWTSALGGPFEINSWAWQNSLWLRLVQSDDEAGLSLRSSGLMTEATSSLKMDKSSVI